MIDKIKLNAELMDVLVEEAIKQLPGWYRFMVGCGLNLTILIMSVCNLVFHLPLLYSYIFLFIYLPSHYYLRIRYPWSIKHLTVDEIKNHISIERKSMFHLVEMFGNSIDDVYQVISQGIGAKILAKIENKYHHYIIIFSMCFFILSVQYTN